MDTLRGRPLICAPMLLRSHTVITPGWEPLLRAHGLDSVEGVYQLDSGEAIKRSGSVEVRQVKLEKGAGTVFLKKYWIGKPSQLWSGMFRGTFFGRLGDLIGRSRALSLTILTYAVFTGLSFFATEWWHLMIFRFLAALGIGGEWAVGSTLLSETWPKAWRKWLAAVLQTAVNIGILLACLAGFLMKDLPPNYIFLVGVLPALIVFWIRKHVPEPEAWEGAQSGVQVKPGMMDLFRGSLVRITVPAVIVCAFSLTAWWAFLFWQSQYMRALAAAAQWSAPDVNSFVARSFGVLILVSVPGNFFAGWLATRLGYRRAIALMFGGFVVTVIATFGWPHPLEAMGFFWLPAVGFWSGVYGLFTMYLPPLFPSLLRTTGAGFCYNIGRFAAAAGTVFAVQITGGGDFRRTLLWAAVLWIPAIIAIFFLPEPEDESIPGR